MGRPLKVRQLLVRSFCVLALAAAGAFLRQHFELQQARMPLPLREKGQAGLWPGQAPSPAGAQLPKVALMFLTRGPLPLEPIWADFLSAASAATQPNSSSVGRGSSAPRQGWQRLFSIHIHPPPGFAYPSDSIFAGHEVERRVAVQWGHATELVAQLLLLGAGLADPLNQRFVMLSESCVPLYPPATIYWQLLSESRSRINTCTGWDIEDYMWKPGMADFGLVKESWRKSSQWTALIRKHAELVVGDAVVVAAFHKECRAESWPNWCLSTEHYIPTLLAYLGLEAEADCSAVITHDAWEHRRAPHPKLYQPEEASSGTVRSMRGKTCLEKSKCHFGSCQQQYEGSPGHNRAVGAAMKLLVQQYLTTSPAADSTGLVGSGSTARGCGQEAALGGFKLLHQVTADLNVTTLAPSCPLFGRKINGTGAERWALVLKPFLVE